jgi:DNA polymerase-3 subunit epsilon
VTSWTDMPTAAFDLETSGTDVLNDRIVTGCLARIDSGDVHCRRWIADPGIPIPAEATAIHGISTEYAQKYGMPHQAAVHEIVNELYAAWSEGRYIAVYNGAFDFSMIATYAPDFEIRGPIFDARVIDRQFDRFRKGSRKLSAVCIHYGVRLDDAHDAEGDALAAARLAWKMPRLYPAIAQLTPDELMTKQAHWYREDAYRYIDWCRRNDRPFDDVPTEWPIRRRLEEAA